jgi:hypothetical protein
MLMSGNAHGKGVAAATVFNAAEWIRTNCVGADALKPATLQIVSSFTLMWNFFENTVCDRRANIAKFDEIATLLAQRKEPPVGIAESLRFWVDRYYDGAAFNTLFDGLEFREGDRRNHVEAVLSGASDDLRDQLLAVMIIVYRLRNNLFHGLKEIPTLNNQVGNLDMACRALAGILLAFGIR